MTLKALCKFLNLAHMGTSPTMTEPAHFKAKSCIAESILETGGFAGMGKEAGTT
jgi:hypothetical protein